MADPTDRQAPGPVEGEIVPTLSDAEAGSFKRASIPRIKDWVDRLYPDCHRDPMGILSLVATTASRPVRVQRDYNANIPYAVPVGGAIELHVLHKVPDDVVAKYKTFIDVEFKPELVRVAKELDRAAQEDLITEARKGVAELNGVRQSLPGAKFDSIDERLLAVANEPDVYTVSVDQSGRVKALLDNVFSQ